VRFAGRKVCARLRLHCAAGVRHRHLLIPRTNWTRLVPPSVLIGHVSSGPAAWLLGCISPCAPRPGAWRKGREAWTRRVQLVRKEGRDVSTWYGREKGGVVPECSGDGQPWRLLEGVRRAERRKGRRGGAARETCPVSTGGGGRGVRPAPGDDGPRTFVRRFALRSRQCRPRSFTGEPPPPPFPGCHTVSTHRSLRGSSGLKKYLFVRSLEYTLSDRERCDKAVLNLRINPSRAPFSVRTPPRPGRSFWRTPHCIPASSAPLPPVLTGHVSSLLPY
jgi:hypothetical protein